MSTIFGSSSKIQSRIKKNKIVLHRYNHDNGDSVSLGPDIASASW